VEFSLEEKDVVDEFVFDAVEVLVNEEVVVRFEAEDVEEELMDDCEEVEV